MDMTWARFKGTTFEPKAPSSGHTERYDCLVSAFGQARAGLLHRSFAGHHPGSLAILRELKEGPSTCVLPRDIRTSWALVFPKVTGPEV